MLNQVYMCDPDFSLISVIYDILVYSVIITVILKVFEQILSALVPVSVSGIIVEQESPVPVTVNIKFYLFS